MLTVRWWDRIWVVQEVVTARRVIVKYGNTSAPWSMLVSVARVATQEALSKYTSPVTGEDTKVLGLFSRVIGIDRFRQTWRGGKETTLLALLRDFGYRRASDDRDKIYGLLGLRSHGGIVRPYYALGAKEAYILAAVDCIRESESLAALSGDLGRKNRNDLPSWVPDWSAQFDESDRRRADLAQIYNACDGTISIIEASPYQVSNGFFTYERRVSVTQISNGPTHAGIVDPAHPIGFDANLEHPLPGLIASSLHSYRLEADSSVSELCEKLIGSCRPKGRRNPTGLLHRNLIYVEPGYECLGMYAKFIGKVAQVFEPLYSSNDMNAVSKTIITWAKGVHPLEPWEQADHDKKVAFVTALVSDVKKTTNGFERLTVRDVPALMDWYEKTILERTTNPIEPELGVGVLDSFTEAMRVSTTNRVFFITEEGAMGLGPTSTRELDEIYVLPGGRVPFVLRRTNRQDRFREQLATFRLVGGCFLHGFMGDPSKSWPLCRCENGLPCHFFNVFLCSLEQSWESYARHIISLEGLRIYHTTPTFSREAIQLWGFYEREVIESRKCKSSREKMIVNELFDEMRQLGDRLMNLESSEWINLI